MEQRRQNSCHDPATDQQAAILSSHHHAANKYNSMPVMDRLKPTKCNAKIFVFHFILKQDTFARKLAMEVRTTLNHK